MGPLRPVSEADWWEERFVKQRLARKPVGEMLARGRGPQ